MYNTCILTKEGDKDGGIWSAVSDCCGNDVGNLHGHSARGKAEPGTDGIRYESFEVRRGESMTLAAKKGSKETALCLNSMKVGMKQLTTLVDGKGEDDFSRPGPTLQEIQTMLRMADNLIWGLVHNIVEETME